MLSCNASIAFTGDDTFAAFARDPNAESNLSVLIRELERALELAEVTGGGGKLAVERALENSICGVQEDGLS